MPTNSNINTKNICSVIVLYDPPADLAGMIASIEAQCGQLVLVDNGLNDEKKAEIEALAAKNKAIELVTNPQNNLAKAHNLGIQYAKEHGFEYVLLLDEDSKPAENMVSTMLEAYAVLDDEEQIGLIAPLMEDTNSQAPTRYITPWLILGFQTLKPQEHSVLRQVMMVVTSGSLIPVRVLDSVGWMDESYVIDYIDKEFCLRLMSRGYETIVVTNAKLQHSIGKRTDHDMMGMKISSTNHSASRRHTIYRNRLRTIGRYAFAVPSFVVYDLLGMGYDLLRILLFEQAKGEKLKAIALGIYDALLGKAR